MLTVLADLASWSLWAFMGALVAAQLVLKEVGYRFGRNRTTKKDGKDEGVGIVSTSVYGLLAFALAFNLSMSSTRFAERRDATLNEANSIGTVWLQATAVDHPRGAAIAALLTPYTELRKAALEADRNSPEIAESYEQINKLQTEIWGHLMALLRDRVDPQVVQLEGSLNAMFDSTTSVRFAVGQDVPTEVIALLLVLTMCSMAILGYQFGLIGHPHRILSGVMILVWTTVMITILDLGSARVGDIRVGTAIYTQTVNGFGEVPIPPLP